jgi:predicted ABC-type ATPase
MRVKKGGFHVPPLAIENNYWGNMEMLDKNFPMFDSVELIDTSLKMISIAKLLNGNVGRSIPPDQVPEWLKSGMPIMFELIKKFYNVA